MTIYRRGVGIQRCDFLFFLIAGARGKQTKGGNDRAEPQPQGRVLQI